MNDLSLLATDAVLFELPSPDDADDLARTLHESCIAWTERWDDVWIVGAELRDDDDLAPLLRAAERWVAERHLVAIRFSLDAKAYILRAGEIAWSAALPQTETAASLPDGASPAEAA
jgi:hypothetical protein